MKRICEIEINFKGDQILDGTKFHIGQYLAYSRDFDPSVPDSFDVNFEKIIDTATTILKEGAFSGLEYDSITIRFGQNDGSIGDGNLKIQNTIAERSFKVDLNSEEFEIVDFVSSNIL